MIEIELTKAEQEEFNNIAQNQSVFAGDLLSHYTAQSLFDKGLVITYEGEYCLSNKGDKLKNILK